ncbi:PorV/PorQ family protein [candidate division TA06 bacterium]|nr:PorV/PorQ family protein [candidate division TA06 bacterium]
MKRLIYFSACCLFLPASSILYPVSASPQETPGLVFLKIGMGARSNGMGDASSSVQGDATALYWNPAGLVGIEGTDLSIAHNEYFESIRYEFAGFAYGKGKQAFGVALGGLFMDDGLELRGENPGDPIGIFHPHDIFLSFSYARQIGEEASVGVTFKGLHERIYIHSLDTWALDLGLQLQPQEVKGLRLSGVLQNLGPTTQLVEEKMRIPTTVRFGGGYLLPWKLLDGKLFVAADGVKAILTDFRYNAGIEFDHKSGMQLRFGYKFNYDIETFSAGAGFKVEKARVDYAFVPYSDDFENTHRVSLGFGF